jgi:hypothetical protein
MTTISRNPDRLYELLPALYRIADSAQGNKLRALLALITREADVLRDDAQQLWDDFFIETCERWAIPYIGDLVGNNPLHDLDLTPAAATAQSLFTDLTGPDLRPPGAIRTRADVAKTIYYRRRKGTPPMLEELARDVTGWGAHVVEFFTLLDWNQHLEHLRLDCHGCPDLRRVDLGDRVGGPWDTTTHTVDVRRINEWDGWYNIPNIGFFLWRLRAYRLTKITPRAIGGTSWRLTFSPLGQNIPLFSAGRREPGESRMATELTVETPIRAAAFFEDLETVPAPPPTTARTAFYGDLLTTDASLVVFANGAAVQANHVKCTNLANWTAFAQPAGMVIGIDVTRGRLIVPKGRAGQTITVSYYYGFSAPMAGGEYDRAKWLVPSPPPIPVIGGGLALDNALAARPAVPRTVIEVGDDATYNINTDITLAADESLTIQGANGARPHLRLKNGSIAILTAGAGASLTLGGVLIEGGLRIDGDLATLRLLHSTLVPGRSVEQEAGAPPTGASFVVAPGPAGAPINTRLEVQIAFSIVGALRMPSHITKLWLLDSIVDGIERNGGPFVAAVSDAAGVSGPPAHIERSTLFGTARFLKLELASESIFTDLVRVDQQQQGCVRFSFVPRGSKTPQQYRCQPALETALEIEKKRTDAAKAGIVLPAGWEALLAAEVADWLVPSFESDRYGRPEFAQLRRTCPIQIRTGAEDGSEMGVFCVLKQPQRESNLRIRLDEYLPVGLEAGVIYVT